MELNQKVTIIIPTYNRENIVEQTLKHIELTCLYPKELFEVIVVNDGKNSIEYLKDIVLNLNFSIINNPGQGAASARNFGCKFASYDFIIFIDDDILIESNHIQKHLLAHQKNPKSIVTANRIEFTVPEYILKKSSFARYKAKVGYIWHEGSVIKKIDDTYQLMNDIATFSCSLFKKDFIEIGMFDEGFSYVGREDSDFFYRARKMGYNLIYDTKNNCDHNEPFNFKLEQWLWRQYTEAMGYVLFCEKHTEWKKEILYLNNLPVNSNDVFRLKLRKYIISILSSSLILKTIKAIVISIDKLNLPDKFMHRVFSLLFLIYTNLGFKKGLELHKIKLPH